MSTTRRPVRRLRPARDPIPSLGDAVDAFLAQPDLGASSHRSYAQTLARLRDAPTGRSSVFVEMDQARAATERLVQPATFS